MYYLFGPGRREEHTDPHLVAGWRHPAELEPSLRADGCEYVVAVLHDGVRGPLPANKLADGEHFAFLGSWYRCVDAVVGGHTLWRATAIVNGVAFCQPAAYGAEVGVIELGHTDGPRLSSLVPRPAGPWVGSGSRELAGARSEVLAELSRPVTALLGSSNPFLDAIAAVMVSRTGADVALVSLWDCYVIQPVDHDNVAVYFPAGPFRRTDLLRLTQEPDDPVAVIALDAAQLDVLRDHLRIPFLPALGTAGAAPTRGRVTVALTACQAQHACSWLGTADPPAIPDSTATFGDVLTEVIERW